MNSEYPNLYIVEEEYEEDAKHYPEILGHAQRSIEKYCSIMESIHSEKVMQGDKADKILEFSKLASESMSSYLVDLSTLISYDLKKYIEEIEKTDSYTK